MILTFALFLLIGALGLLRNNDFIIAFGGLGCFLTVASYSFLHL